MRVETYIKEAEKEYKRYRQTKNGVYLAQAGEKLYGAFKVLMKEVLGLKGKIEYEKFRKELYRFIYHLKQKDRHLRDLVVIAQTSTRYLHIYFNEGYFDTIDEYEDALQTAIETLKELLAYRDELKRLAKEMRK